MTAPSPKVEQRHRDAADRAWSIRAKSGLAIAFAAFERDLLTPSGGGGTEAHRIERRMVVDLDKRRVAILAKLIGMLSIMAGEGPEIIGYDPAQLHAEASMAIGIEDQDDIDGMAADIVEHGPDAHLLTERLDRIALTPSGDAEGRARELLGQAVWPMMDEAEAKAWLEKRMPGGPGGQVGIDYALRAITAALTSAPQPLREALEKCRAQFDFYVQQHMAKQPPDMDKAATNQEFVELCDEALAMPGDAK